MLPWAFPFFQWLDNVHSCRKGMGAYMRALLRSFAGLVLALVCVTTARAVTLEDFSSQPMVKIVAVSETGRYLAISGGDAAQTGDVLRVIDLTQPKTPLTTMPLENLFVVGMSWKGDKRLILQVMKRDMEIRSYLSKDKKTTVVKTFAMDPDGNNILTFFNDVPRMQRYGQTGAIESILPNDPSHVLMSAPSDRGGISLQKVDVFTGASEIVEAGSGATVEWQATPDGVPYLRTDFDFEGGNLKTYGKAKGGSWKKIAVTDIIAERRNDDFSPLTLTESGTSIYAISRSTHDTLGAYEVSLEDGHAIREIFTHPNVDLDGGIVNRYTGQLNGLAFTVDRPDIHFLNQNWQAAYKLLQDALPGQNIAVVSYSRNFSHVAVRASAASVPPTYYLYDVAGQNLTKIADVFPNLRNAQLGDTQVVTYKSADGTTIRAYLTLPPGKSKNLPMVVVPHGGPEARDDVGYDPLFVQPLVSRGYAVIQPQFRGSGGFGKAFADAGHLQWGKGVMDDIEGSVKYAVAQGIADPKRVCVFGWSFGGYSALASAAFKPDTYACAVGGAGVYDLRAMLDWERERSTAAFTYWQRQMGDPVDETASSAKYAAAIKIPVMLITGDKDTTVPKEQTELMAAAMAAAGKPVQTVILPDETHNLEKYSSRLQMLQSVIGFIDQHIGSK